VAPDIRWFALSKPYGARRAGDERRPPYDRAGFARALRTGIASDGASLDPAMPHFDLAEDEIDALQSYLQQLSDHGDPHSARPALILMIPRNPAPAAERLRDGLQRCPGPVALNGPGARSLPALRVVRYDPDAYDDEELAKMAKAGTAAALFAPYLIGAEDAFARAGTAARLPVLLPMALREIDSTVRPLYAMPGLRVQAEALIVTSPPTIGDRLAIVIDPAMHGRAALASRLTAVARSAGWQPTVHDAPDTAIDGDADAVLMLSDLPAPPASLSRPARLWLTAAFLMPDRMNAWIQRGASVRIALPYTPTVDGSPRWIPPTDVWVAAGCELIATLPPLPQNGDGVATWRASLATLPDIRLGEWVHLPSDGSDGDAVQRVFISDWPPTSR
jgi:hypothetical protein